MDQSRRDALKKLGIGTGVVWAAPAVTVLVVPTHASATSSSGTGVATVTAVTHITASNTIRVTVELSSNGITGLTGTIVMNLGGNNTNISLTQSGTGVSSGSAYAYTLQNTATTAALTGPQPTIAIPGFTVVYGAGVQATVA